MAPRIRFSRQLLVVLEALARSPRSWRHGYDLMKETGLAAGTLYPILARLVEIGWIESEWVEPSATGRPPRRRHRLTASGRSGAREMAARAVAVRHRVKHA